MRHHDTHLTDEDLLLMIDGELPQRRHISAEAHLTHCDDCRARRDRIGRVTALVVEACSRDAEPADIGRARHALRSALAATATSMTRSWRFAFASMLAATPAWAMIAAVTATSLLAFDLHTRSTGGQVRIAGSVEQDALPISSLTPGATLPLGPEELCVEAPRVAPRRLPASLRDQVLRQYGMEHVSPAEYELDYLITPELGGAPEAANLWPERYGLPNWNAHVKDQLEELLPRLVCNGTLPLAVAQHAIASDWIAAYKRYFNTTAPLAARAALRADDELIFEDAERPLLTLIALSAPSAIPASRF